MSITLKRRWFAFSLKTLFVVVTVLGCWLGWQLREMRKRAEARTWIVEHEGTWYSYDASLFTARPKGAFWDRVEAQQYPKFSWTRMLLGDTPIALVLLPERNLKKMTRKRANQGVTTWEPIESDDLPNLRELFPKPFMALNHLRHPHTVRRDDRFPQPVNSQAERQMTLALCGGEKNR